MMDEHQEDKAALGIALAVCLMVYFFSGGFF
jgi:hypothetical protein